MASLATQTHFQKGKDMVNWVCKQRLATLYSVVQSCSSIKSHDTLPHRCKTRMESFFSISAGAVLVNTSVMLFGECVHFEKYFKCALLKCPVTSSSKLYSSGTYLVYNFVPRPPPFLFFGLRSVYYTECNLTTKTGEAWERGYLVYIVHQTLPFLQMWVWLVRQDDQLIQISIQSIFSLTQSLIRGLVTSLWHKCYQCNLDPTTGNGQQVND